MSRNWSVPESDISKDVKDWEVENIDIETDLTAIRSNHVGIGTSSFAAHGRSSFAKGGS